MGSANLFAEDRMCIIAHAVSDIDELRGLPLLGVLVGARQLPTALLDKCYHLMCGENVEYRCGSCDNKLRNADIHIDPLHVEHWKRVQEHPIICRTEVNGDLELYTKCLWLSLVIQ